MRIYLDACCLNRPFDDLSQARIRLENEAVLTILERIAAGAWTMIATEVLLDELDATPDPQRRAWVRHRADQCSTYLETTVADLQRATELEPLGIEGRDALHLACAEREAAGIFLTTDDVLHRRATRHCNLRT
jgi:predicted nucleic acid-binding protein